MRTAISPTRAENYAEWYQQVIKAADMAEASPVRGCMVIKPWGYGLWENIQRSLDAMFKATGHQNIYLPLFIPLSFFEKEAEHVAGFAKECAVVTHRRLVEGSEGGLMPDGELEEPLIVRPTSETMVGAMFARWVQSHRDLPLLMNQWANVVRWEMRTRLFLRTTEFLWQEGHTAHATEQDAREETLKMLGVYAEFAEQYLAIPVIRGEKTESQRFPGAVTTYCIEAMMQDRKALQAGTSHFLGQNFSRAWDISFQDERGQQEFAWTTSWGVSTRLIGGLIMVHSDDDGLIVPPRVAPTHAVILPVIHNEEAAASVMEHCRRVAAELRQTTYDGAPIRVEIDLREGRGGEKRWSWVKKGVPILLEVGPRDVSSDGVFLRRRDLDPKQHGGLARAQLVATAPALLAEIQDQLLARARAFQEEHTVRLETKEEFYRFFTPRNADNPEIHGGFAFAHWNGDPAVEAQVAADLGVTIRCIPFGEPETGTCVISGEPSSRRVVWAKAY